MSTKNGEVIKKDPATTVDKVYVSVNGDKILLRSVAPFLLQRAQNKIKLPKPPRYDVKTAGGRIESYYLDEKAAEEVDHGTQLWNTHQEDKREAEAERNNVIVTTIFAFGVESVEYSRTDWERPYRLVGDTVPADPDEKMLFYLLNELMTEDVTVMLNRIMRLSGVTEEKVKEAEDSFRGEVPAGSGVPRRSNGFGADPGSVAESALAV